MIHSRNARTTESLNFLLFNFCNNYLLVEVSNKEIFEFLAGSLTQVFKFFLMGVP